MDRWELGRSINMKKKRSNNSGLSILEALVSTAIVGIGFIAILQMTNFSAQSITNSGERTKANYLTGMIAEDIIGSKNTLFGINSKMKFEHLKIKTFSERKIGKLYVLTTENAKKL